MKKLILLITFTCTLYVLNAQLSTRELPPSFINNIENLHTSPKNTKVLPKFDLQKLRIEDEIDENAGIPPRFGYKQKVDFSIKTSGEWTTLPNGDKLWRLQIKSPGALSINLLYKKYWLPKQGKLFIYSADRHYSIGAFTSANNKSSINNIQGFATGLVYSDNIILEYYQPKNVIEQAIISIEYVVHGYRYINIEGNKALGGSGNCQVDINCTEGDDWQNEKDTLIMRRDGEKVKAPPFHRIFTLTFKTEKDVDLAIDILRKSKAIVFAEKNSQPILDNDVLTSSAGGWRCGGDTIYEERLAVQEILDNGTAIVMPAGNGVHPDATNCKPLGETQEQPWVVTFLLLRLIHIYKI